MDQLECFECAVSSAVDRIRNFLTTLLRTPDPTRINDVIAIRKLYADDAVFNTRQIPKYYHTTLKMQYFKGIIEEKHILATNASYPGAWTANGKWTATQFF